MGSGNDRSMTPFRAAVYDLVRSIPKGRVLSYGAVATLLGHPRSARGVGTALSALPPEHDVPWWRVVSHDGRITTPRIHHLARIQRQLLEQEGLSFTESDRVDMSRHAWSPDPDALPRAAIGLGPR